MLRGVQLLLTPFFIVVEKPNRIAGCRVTTFFGTTTCGVVAERVDWRKIAIALIDIGKGGSCSLRWRLKSLHTRDERTMMANTRFIRMTICGILLTAFQCVQAQAIRWAGHTWKVTSGGMAGVALGNPANVDVNPDGYLHLQITQREGKWTAAELFTTDTMGFGTYQWVIEGDVYNMDQTTVLGLFTYGPTVHIGVDAENEIDIEFSQWNKTCHGCDADFTVYPSTGNRKPNGVSSWEDNFQVTGGNLTTARMEWRSDRVVFTLMNGVHPIGSVADVIKTDTYSSNTTNIPQTAAPVGINLWCFKGTPSSNQSAIIRDFRFVPQ